MPSISRNFAQITLLHFELAIYGSACGIIGVAGSLLVVDPDQNWLLSAAAALTVVVAAVQWQIIVGTFHCAASD